MLSKISKETLRTVGLLAISLLLAACGFVSQGDYDAAKEALAAQDQKVGALQQQLSTKEKELAEARQKAAAPETKAATSTDVIPLVGAKQVPPPAPRPTPTPLPPGATPPPPPPAAVPPASFSDVAGLYIYADTVTSGPGESPFNYDAASLNAKASCVQTSVFRRGMRIVWRYEVVDVASGKRLTDKEIESAGVRLPDGAVRSGRFGRHGASETSPWFWTSNFDIPLNYPLGTLDWVIEVKSKDGKTGSFRPWVVSIPERGVESRLQIVD